MKFVLTTTNLRRLCALNSFSIPSDKILLFGIRGCLPQNTDNQRLETSHALELAAINYINPRCTIGIWKLDSDEFALFPGSTVPSQKYILSADPNHFNQLIPGAFSGWHRGTHNKGKKSAHEAFRNDTFLPVVRTMDDRNFDTADRIFTNKIPNDNIHAAFCMEMTDRYDSAGCQVVVGKPRIAGVRRSDRGPWRLFRELINEWAPNQVTFDYMLFRGPNALSATAAPQHQSLVLRFGSEGPLVEALQRKLNDLGEQLQPDGEFGFNTLHALLRFQEKKLGLVAADGVVGKVTATALGLDLRVV
jgi:hypothetical protein